MILFDKISRLWLKITWNFTWIILKPIIRSKIVSLPYGHLESLNLPVILLVIISQYMILGLLV